MQRKEVWSRKARKTDLNGCAAGQCCYIAGNEEDKSEPKRKGEKAFEIGGPQWLKAGTRKF